MEDDSDIYMARTGASDTSPSPEPPTHFPIQQRVRRAAGVTSDGPDDAPLEGNAYNQRQSRQCNWRRLSWCWKFVRDESQFCDERSPHPKSLGVIRQCYNSELLILFLLFTLIVVSVLCGRWETYPREFAK
jgi:hypothetical protein